MFITGHSCYSFERMVVHGLCQYMQLQAQSMFFIFLLFINSVFLIEMHTAFPFVNLLVFPSFPLQLCQKCNFHGKLKLMFAVIQQGASQS